MTDEEKARLKAEIIRERGYWAPFHEVLMARAPGFLRAYIGFQAAPTRTKVLSPKLCEFIYIAIDLSVNHMYERGARRHVGYALDAGATSEEILQVILLITAVAAHQSVDAGLDILREELGEDTVATTLDPEIAATRDAYAALTGHWSESGDLLCATDPALARAYMAYGSAAWDAGPLSRKDKELIALAVSAAPTCLFERGIRRHIRGALDAGASAREIATTLHLSAALAIHTCTLGVPAFADVMTGKTVD